jgi:hypothetical protein
VGETRKITRLRNAKRDLREVVHVSGEPTERKLTEEEGELRGVRVGPECEILYSTACGEYATCSGAVDQVSQAQGFDDCEEIGRLGMGLNETEEYLSAALVSYCNQFVKYAVDPASLH